MGFKSGNLTCEKLQLISFNEKEPFNPSPVIMNETKGRRTVGKLFTQHRNTMIVS